MSQEYSGEQADEETSEEERFAPNTVEALRKPLYGHMTIVPGTIASTKT